MDVQSSLDGARDLALVGVEADHRRRWVEAEELLDQAGDVREPAQFGAELVEPASCLAVGAARGPRIHWVGVFSDEILKEVFGRNGGRFSFHAPFVFSSARREK